VKIGEFWTKRTRIDFRIYIGQKGDGDGTGQLLHNASGGLQSALDRGAPGGGQKYPQNGVIYYLNDPYVCREDGSRY